MKITGFDITHMKRGRSVLQIRTDAGITGLSEADGQIFQADLEYTIKPLLIGEDPRQIDRHWETLYLGSQKQIPREAKLRPQIVGAVDIALWDILGKDAGLPCHALMGGAARIDIPLYWSVGSGWKKTPEQMLDDVKVGWEEGYKSYKIRMDWKSYRQDANPANDLAIFKLVRDFLPDNIYLGFDANNGYSVPTAIQQGRAFEDLRTHRPLRRAAPPVRPPRPPPSRRRPRRRNLHRRTRLGPMALPRHHPDRQPRHPPT